MALAEDRLHLRGVVTGRGTDGTLLVQNDASDVVPVVLADATRIRRIDGMRSIRMSSAALMPGLRVRVTGRMDGEHFIADRVTFSREDLKIAKAIEAGKNGR